MHFFVYNISEIEKKKKKRKNLPLFQTSIRKKKKKNQDFLRVTDLGPYYLLI